MKNINRIKQFFTPLLFFSVVVVLVGAFFVYRGNTVLARTRFNRRIITNTHTGGVIHSISVHNQQGTGSATTATLYNPSVLLGSFIYAQHAAQCHYRSGRWYHAVIIGYGRPSGRRHRRHPIYLCGNSNTFGSITTTRSIAIKNIHTTVQYYTSVYDNGLLVSPGSTVSVGDILTLKFSPHVSTDISWFGSVINKTVTKYNTTTFFDTPYGSWGSNTTCSFANTVSPGLYVTLIATPPHETISSLAPVLGGSGCGTLTSSAGGGFQTSCTVQKAGNTTPVFNLAQTYATFRSYTGSPGSCSQLGSASTVTIPAQQITYHLNVRAPITPPSVPTLSCSSHVIVGQPVTISAVGTNPSNTKIRYGIDWLSSGAVNQWAPASGYVNSGTSQTATHVWTVPGTYTIRARTQNTSGILSGWSPSCSVKVNLAPINGSCSVTHYTCTTGTSANDVNGSSSWAWQCKGANGGSTAICSETKLACTLPWGGIIPSGTSVTSYRTSSVTSPSTCSSQTRTCNNGTLNGSYTNKNCTITYPQPTVAISVAPSTIYSGQSTRISWSSTNAASCISTGGFSTDGRTAGSVSSGPLTASTQYQIYCYGAGGGGVRAYSSAKSVTVRSSSKSVTTLAPTGTLSVYPTRVEEGTKTQIKFTLKLNNVSSTDTCSINKRSTSEAMPGVGSMVRNSINRANRFMKINNPLKRTPILKQDTIINTQTNYYVVCNGKVVSKPAVVNVVPTFNNF